MIVVPFLDGDVADRYAETAIAAAADGKLARVEHPAGESWPSDVGEGRASFIGDTYAVSELLPSLATIRTADNVLAVAHEQRAVAETYTNARNRGLVRSG